MKYQVFVDIPLDEEWEECEVETLIIEADSPDEAMEKVDVEMVKTHENFYIWQVTNDDIIEEDE